MFLLIIFLLFEKNIFVTFSKFFIFLILIIIFFLGLKCNTVENTFGLGKKQFDETSNLFIIANL